jgi:hypothetical protein
MRLKVRYHENSVVGKGSHAGDGTRGHDTPRRIRDR